MESRAQSARELKMPLHPGAEAYYREKGYWQAAVEQQHQHRGGLAVKNNPMGIRGLDHFSIPVSDTRRSLTF